ncbi:hypothetical protein CRE_04236 [Caenorhabditis remanei]|uniref:F-box domain-containing protein n=1 Tax=Caenorhabditis remanei TaxID=31234 RepID=E3MYW3_CAERE|nr:hypothetical protein CRE_04236 [Caenorhabditis remanei]
MTEVSKPFSLFRLPGVPMTKISRYMNLREILLVSFVSKKSAFIMKSILPPNWFNLEMKFSENSEISLIAKGTWVPIKVKSQKTGDVFELQIAQDNGVIAHRWTSRDFKAIVKQLLTHFATVFNPTISIDFETAYIQEFVIRVLQHVKQLNLVITSLKILSGNISPEGYKYILEMHREVPELSMFCEVASHFKYRVGPDFRVDDFLVSDGHWMHFEDFVNCKKVTVLHRNDHKQKTYANPEVLRAFIRKWIESDCRLEYLEVYGGFILFRFREVLSGLEYRTIEQTEYSHIVEITRRCDGRKGKVTCGTDHFELNVID